MQEGLRLEPGLKLDRYELLWPVAEGGMGAVWLARLSGKHGFEKLVAIKTILAEHGNDERFERMLLDEARIASGIHHPNVAQILDLGEERGVLYLVMEWVDGDSLSKLFRAVKKDGKSLPLGVALRIVAETAAGLHAAHELRDSSGALAGVVHRDVSPQNILVCPSGAIKLIDFGIAKAINRLAGETSTGFVKGKVSYMAPEQALGSEIDRRTDVWALGAVLYFLLAARAPYEADNQMAVLNKLVTKQPPDPLPRNVPMLVVNLVNDALAHDPARRIPTAAALQKRLEEVMAQVGAHTTTTDVGQYVTVHLADRNAQRKKVIERALEAARLRAEEPESVRELPVPSGEDADSRPMLTPSESRQRVQIMAAAEEPTESSIAKATASSIATRPTTRAKSSRALALGVLTGFIAVGFGVALSFVLRTPTEPTTRGTEPRASVAAEAPSAAPSPAASAPPAAPPAPPPAASAPPPPSPSASAAVPAKKPSSRPSKTPAPKSSWGF